MSDAGSLPELSLGVMARSRKPNERRLAIHPRLLGHIPGNYRSRIYLEEGYGQAFGFHDDDLRRMVAGVVSREELAARCDVVLQPKPTISDLEELGPGQVLWGWPHCVQDSQITQAAINNRLTLIAFESMHYWNSNGSIRQHVFARNNELAGHSAVLHALQLNGITGGFGQPMRAVVIGFGATGRGALGALRGMGVEQVDIVTKRSSSDIETRSDKGRVIELHRSGVTQALLVETEKGPQQLSEVLREYDIIVNCSLQDPMAPLMYLTDGDLPNIQRGTLIVDVSCDTNMGFSWSRPTTFQDPLLLLENGVVYYAVDHTPSYLWAAATWEIGLSLLPFIPLVMSGSASWEESETLRRAVEIRDGIVLNSAILAFQGRMLEYPHAKRRDHAPAGVPS